MINSSTDSIRLQRVSVRRSGATLLNDVDFEHPPQRCLTIIGPNGAGKTTLLKVLLGLITPTRGAVWFGDRALLKLSRRERARLSAYVPQALPELPAIRVDDFVSLGRYRTQGPLGRTNAEDQRAVADALRTTEVESIADRDVSTLSGGERQKVLIAAALAQDAQQLVLDEPTTALDPKHQVAIVRILNRWLERGRGVVLVSHDLNVPAALGGRVIALDRGSIIADDDADTLLCAERLQDVFQTEFETRSAAPQPRLGMP